MGYRVDRASRLPALAALATTSTTLLGPHRSLKHIVGGDTSTLSSHIAVVLQNIANESPTMALLQKTVATHDSAHGTGCTLLVNLVRAFADAALELQARGVNVAEITKGFQGALVTVLATCDRMQIDVDEWIREVFSPVPATPLERISKVLVPDDWQDAMAIAVAIAKLVPPVRSALWQRPTAVHFHTQVGSTHTQLLDGLVVATSADHQAALRDILRGGVRCRAVVLVDAAVAFSEQLCTALETLGADTLVASHGIDAPLHDWCRSRGIICLATRQLHAVAAALQLPVYPSVLAVLYAKGVSRLPVPVTFTLALCEGVVTDPVDDEPELLVQLSRPALGHCSVLVRRSAVTLAHDAVKTVEICLARLHHAVASRTVLPGGGAVLAACAAAVRQQPGVVSAAFADALASVGALLLRNATAAEELAAHSRVGDVERAFAKGMTESSRFLETAFYGARLRPLPGAQLDAYCCTKEAFRAAVRLVTLTATLDCTVVNLPPVVQAAK
ncbi:hypothetical protein ACHHYP_09156 [Achlya hypogyna]|uniref:Uncharacterized protein n=1 Tax=Achlya hypogyna TaxID=1202772 RepID=A0A1V9ZJD7_ACHHY|nr:hypothetical protein ACHHYP_09156 [Achlya hypogyna]